MGDPVTLASCTGMGDKGTINSCLHVSAIVHFFAVRERCHLGKRGGFLLWARPRTVEYEGFIWNMKLLPRYVVMRDQEPTVHTFTL